MELKLPKRGRPLSVRYRSCELGIDLSSEFVHDLRSLDSNLYPIYHPYQILWDDMVNEYVGSLEDPRYPIVENSFRCGELVMGHVLSNGEGTPTPDGTWHIWRWCEPAVSWAHVIAVESSEPLYLQLLVRRLWLQAKYNDRYGNRGYLKLLEDMDIKQREKSQDDKENLMNDIYKANSSMMNRAMDNFHSGKVAPTNPTKETIMSIPGVSNRSKMVRPLEDREGGLELPDEFS